MIAAVAAKSEEPDEPVASTADASTTSANATDANAADANAADANAADEPVLTPVQAQALLRELIDARILSCIHLEAVFDLAQSLAISLEDSARVSEDRAVAMADALLAPGLRRLPTLLQCYVRVERAMRAEAETAMSASGRTTAAQDAASPIDPPPPSIDTPQRCPGPPIQPPLTRPPPPHRRLRAKKR